MSEFMRIIDTGLLTAAENIAWDMALMELRQKDSIPDTLRFLQFKPCALVGYHQSVADEIRTGYCRANGIDINRRITGGGAIYFDEGQLGWELVFKRSSLPFLKNMADVSRAICESAAMALGELGLNAMFRPRNDIEVDGKKISGTGGAFEKDVVLFQGTLLVDFNLEHLIKALRIPVEKLFDKELLSAKERVTSLKELTGGDVAIDAVKEKMAAAFGSLFGKPLAKDVPAKEEIDIQIKKHSWTKSAAWSDPPNRFTGGAVRQIHSLSKSKGGLIRVTGRFDTKKERLKQVMITGDVFVSPKRLLYDMENALKDVHVDSAVRTVADFLKSYEYDCVELSDSDFINAVASLIEKFQNLRAGLDTSEVNSIETRGATLQEVARDATVMLLPYCAKPPDCEHRNSDSCDECGKCSVGDAYRMSKEAGLRVVSINNYENLREVLESERNRGTKSFIGACCSAFFVKRHNAFAESGMPCAIIDIDDTTCYELNEEHLAYKGEFRKQTTLKNSLLKKVLEMKKADKTAAG